MEQKEMVDIISRHNFLQKLGIATAGLVFTNLASPSIAVGPVNQISETQKQQDHERIMKWVFSEQLNASIPCNSRTALRDFLEEHGYIHEYNRSDRLDSTLLTPPQKQQLRRLLDPIIQDSSNSNDVAYNLLHHLIQQKMKKVAFMNIDNLQHKQLINQLEGALPQWDKVFTHRYVDPTTIKLLDKSNTQSLLNLTHEEHTSSKSNVEVHPNILQAPEDIYEVNWIKKYSHIYAKHLLNQQNIWLKSSDQWTKETSNNRSSNRTSLVEINASSIDGIIALIQDIRTRRNYNQKENITGWTEFGIHKPWPDWHEWGWKIDLGESLLVLIILLEHWITQTGDYSDPVLIGNYEYVFNYHWDDWHLDIKIREINNKSPINKDTLNIAPIKPRWKTIKVPREWIRPKPWWLVT